MSQCFSVWVLKMSRMYRIFLRQTGSSRRTKKLGWPRSPSYLGISYSRISSGSKGIPGQIGNQAMVLVPVIAVVSQDDVGRNTLLERFEILLDFGALVGEKAVAKVSR